MTCADVGLVLQSYLDSELDAGTVARVRTHLDECLRCGLEAEAYEDLKAAVNRSGSLPSEVLARLRLLADSLTRPDADAAD